MKKLLLLLITTTFVFANVGKITALKGQVYIIRDSKQITAKTGSILNLKDKIETKNKARALVLFNDNTSITVGNNSILSINEFVMDFENPKNSKTNFGFGKGIFRTITGKIGKVNPKGFKIKTKSASIGIRGTTLDTSVKILADGTEKVSVAFIKGHGFITSDILGIEIAVNTGENANILQNGQHTLNKGALIETQKLNQDAKTLKSTSTQNEKKKKKNSSEESIDTGDVESEVNSLTEDAKENVNEDIITNKATELKEPVTDDPIDEPTTDDPVDEPTIDDPVDEPTIDDPTDEPTTDDPADEPTTDDPVDEIISTITKETMCPTANICATYSSYGVTDFGYLKNDTDTVIGSYIEGTETSSHVIEEYISNGQTSTYNGTIYGLYSGTNIGSSTTEGTIQLNMDFGTSTFDGNMLIYNGNWQVNIVDGTLNSTGFLSDNLSGTGNGAAITSGKLNGNYYGTDADAAAGTFNVSTGEEQVIGVFGSTK